MNKNTFYRTNLLLSCHTAHSCMQVQINKLLLYVKSWRLPVLTCDRVDTKMCCNQKSSFLIMQNPNNVCVLYQSSLICNAMLDWWDYRCSTVRSDCISDVVMVDATGCSETKEPNRMETKKSSRTWKRPWPLNNPFKAESWALRRWNLSGGCTFVARSRDRCVLL